MLLYQKVCKQPSPFKTKVRINVDECQKKENCEEYVQSAYIFPCTESFSKQISHAQMFESLQSHDGDLRIVYITRPHNTAQQ